MKQNTSTQNKKKLNLFSLVSLLLFPVLLIILLIPWYDLFILRDNALTTLFIRMIAMLIAGALMVASSVTGMVRNHKNKGVYKGNWLGIVGIILGAIFFSYSAFILIDYLIYIN